MRISDWSSDVCSSDLEAQVVVDVPLGQRATERRRVVERRAGLRHVHRGNELFPAAAHLVHEGIGAVWVQHLAVGAVLTVDVSSEERRVGKEWFSTCRSGWSPYH